MGQADESAKVAQPTSMSFPTYSLDFSPLSPREPRYRHVTEAIREVVRPGNLKARHFEALALHVTADADLESIVPDASYLPSPVWLELTESLDILEEATKKPLNNGKKSPGAKTYQERVKELSLNNEDAFRVVRRLPAPSGATNPRLGMAFDLYKHLENIAMYWDDTSIIPGQLPDGDAMDIDMQDPSNPPGLGTSGRTGNNSSMPSEYRSGLLNALVKLVAYDFGCNVSRPRTPPRFSNTSYATGRPLTSSWPAGDLNFVYRIPNDPNLARAGWVEGPLAVLSPRHNISFSSKQESMWDLAREVVPILVTAQHRARQGKEEREIGNDQWWTTKPRWGGGSGGPIGKEESFPENQAGYSPEEHKQSENGPRKRAMSWNRTSLSSTNRAGPADQNGRRLSRRSPSHSDHASGPSSAGTTAATAAAQLAMSSLSTTALSDSAGSIRRTARTTNLASEEVVPLSSDSDDHVNNGVSNEATTTSPERTTRNHTSAKRTHPLYDAYRMLKPPRSTWDPKCKYLSIGKAPLGSDAPFKTSEPGTYDDIFLLSAINHHISIIRCRVPISTLDMLDGAGTEQLSDSSHGQDVMMPEAMPLYRSRWYDMFKAQDRIEAMSGIWGIMSYQMRKIEVSDTSLPTTNVDPSPSNEPFDTRSTS